MQISVNVYYNSELKVTKSINVSTLDSLHNGIRETIVFSMTKSIPQSIPQNATYEKGTATKKGMFFGTEDVSIDKLTEQDLKNVEKIDIYLIPKVGGRRKSRKAKSRKNKRV